MEKRQEPLEATEHAAKPELPKKKRAALYVDGFNLYYPLEKNGKPFLKWLNLWRLGERLSKPLDANLIKVVFCTAIPEENIGKRDRHNKYIAALIAVNVTVLKGHHVFDSDLNKMTEKQSDINVALSLIMDAYDDSYDIAYLLSADSDQAATGRVFSSRFPSKSLISVAPPTKEPPHKLRPYAKKSFALTFEDIELCLFGGTISGKAGLIVRPTEYAPPSGWVHPDDRPRKDAPRKVAATDAPTNPPNAPDTKSAIEPKPAHPS